MAADTAPNCARDRGVLRCEPACARVNSQTRYPPVCCPHRVRDDMSFVCVGGCARRRAAPEGGTGGASAASGGESAQPSGCRRGPLVAIPRSPVQSACVIGRGCGRALVAALASIQPYILAPRLPKAASRTLVGSLPKPFPCDTAPVSSDITCSCPGGNNGAIGCLQAASARRDIASHTGQNRRSAMRSRRRQRAHDSAPLRS